MEKDEAEEEEGEEEELTEEDEENGEHKVEWKFCARGVDDDVENDDVVLSYLSFCVVIAIVDDGNA